MRNTKLMVLVLLALAMTMTAVAEKKKPVTDTATAQAQSDQAKTTMPPPTTMDQVVDRVILREKALVQFLAPRTPVVETYLQDLTQDPQMGPVPQSDHYFLGRMDLSDSIDREDYLNDKGKGGRDNDVSMEKRLLGGLANRFKFQYQPLGFSWMIYADRNEFDRQHYDFHYARREFLGDVRCLVFDILPKKDASYPCGRSSCCAWGGHRCH